MKKEGRRESDRGVGRRRERGGGGRMRNGAEREDSNE